MIRKTLALAIALLAIPAAFLYAGDNTSWMEMENCAMCKNMMQDPGLLNNCTWEHHDIANGIVCVSTVDDKYMDSFKTAVAGMGDVQKKLMNGEKLHVCNMCQDMLDIMSKGAKSEDIMTKHGAVSVLTSSDPALVARLHTWAQRTNSAMAMMEKADQSKTMSKTATKSKSY